MWYFKYISSLLGVWISDGWIFCPGDQRKKEREIAEEEKDREHLKKGGAEGGGGQNSSHKL